MVLGVVEEVSIFLLLRKFQGSMLVLEIIEEARMSSHETLNGLQLSLNGFQCLEIVKGDSRLKFWRDFRSLYRGLQGFPGNF